jgi:hypothetical protein
MGICAGMLDMAVGVRWTLSPKPLTRGAAGEEEEGCEPCAAPPHSPANSHPLTSTQTRATQHEFQP